MKITASTIDVAVPVAAFIRRHYPPARHWPRGILLGWVRWQLGESFLAYVLDGDVDGQGRIVAVGVARPVMRPEHGLEDYRFDPEGPVIFVDLAVSIRPQGLPCLVALLRQRFGFRQNMAFQRRGQAKVHVVSFLHLHRRVFPAIPTA